MSIKFEYPHGIATIELAVRQIVTKWANPTANPLSEEYVTRAVNEDTRDGVRELRSILTSEMSTLFDVEGQAVDWNDAIEHCLRLVEGTL